MAELVPALVILGVIIAVLGLMALGWRSRRRRQSHLPAPALPPADLGVASASFDAMHVATTLADEPLERVAVHGLGFRASTNVAVHPEGIVLDLLGRDSLYIPASALCGAGRATWTIDRAVEKDGLVFVRWMLGSTAIDSYFRLADAATSAALVDATLSLIPPAVTSPTSGPDTAEGTTP